MYVCVHMCLYVSVYAHVCVWQLPHTNKQFSDAAGAPEFDLIPTLFTQKESNPTG